MREPGWDLTGRNRWPCPSGAQTDSAESGRAEVLAMTGRIWESATFCLVSD